MKVLDRYTLQSVLTVALITMLLATLILLSVDLFANLDDYLSEETPISLILQLTLLAVPEALIFSIAPSLLFSISYYLSQSEANNEMLCLTGAGFSFRRIIIPIFALAILFSLAQGLIYEKLQIPASLLRQQMEDDHFGVSSSYDSRNLTVSDPSGRYIVRSARYSDRTESLSEVLILLLDPNGRLMERIDAKSATYQKESGLWNLEDVRVQAVTGDSSGIEEFFYEKYHTPTFTLAPEYFREMSDDIKTMNLKRAVQYLDAIKRADIERYYPLAVEFAKRFFDSLSPFVLSLVALTVSYRFKKNVLLFSIISSLSIAVIYYVLQMLTLIIARQGVISAQWAMVIPMVVVFLVAFIERQIVKVT